MACVSSLKNKSGTVFDVQFYIGSEKKKMCGYKTKRQTERARDKLDSLVRSRTRGADLPQDVVDWLAGLDDKFYTKLVSLGLADVRIKAGTIKDLVELFTQDKTVKPQTLKNRQMTANHLFQFFGKATSVASITSEQVIKFDLAMKERLARTTWGREVKTVKQFFNRAVEMGWIKTNPFAKLKGSNVGNKTRFYFVSLQEAERILDACPNAEMRLIFSLARFAGLRIPSELKFMDWSDINLNGDRFIVRVPKATNRKAQEAGQFETRPVPMFPELRKAFQEYRDTLPEGTTGKVFPNCLNGQALTSRFAKILKRAGVAQWPKFFQNMRSTRDTELRRKYPEQDVNLWLGHTKEVPLYHYMQMTDSLFSEASKGEISGMGTNPGVKIWQKVQFIPENTGSTPSEKMGTILGTFIKKMGMIMGTKCYEVKRSDIGLSPQNTALNQEKEKDLILLQVQKIPLGAPEICGFSRVFKGF